MRCWHPPAGAAQGDDRAGLPAAVATPGYGYALLEHLEAAGFDVDANTLYPLLRRLERQGLLSSEWNTDEARPRKYYSTTAAGGDLARALRADWAQLDRALRALEGGA